MSPARWPFAARLLAVSATLVLLLAVAVTLLVVGRRVPVHVAGAATRTVSRLLPPPATAPSAPAGRSPRSIVPAGLPTGPPDPRRAPRPPRPTRDGTATIAVPRARSSAG